MFYAGPDLAGGRPGAQSLASQTEGRGARVFVCLRLFVKLILISSWCVPVPLLSLCYIYVVINFK